MFLCFKYFLRRLCIYRILITVGITTASLYITLNLVSNKSNRTKVSKSNINISAVEFLVNNQICSGVLPIRLLVLITSYIGNISLRTKIRNEYSTHLLESLGVRRVFLLGKPDPYRPINYSSILKENSVHHDILLGNFQEHYRNLTYKHLMGLNWVLTYCPDAQFVLKQDDDIWIDFHALMNHNDKDLQNIFQKLNSTFSIFGNILHENKALRDINSKWYVSEGEYRETFYPDFVSGWAYITTPKVIKLLIEKSYHVPFFWIDDTYVTGIIRTQIHHQPISLLNGTSYFALHSDYTNCCEVIIQKKINSSHFYSCPFLFGPTVEEYTIQVLKDHSENCVNNSKQCTRYRATGKQLQLMCAIVEESIPKQKQPIPNRRGNPVEVKQLRTKLSRKIDTK